MERARRDPCVAARTCVALPVHDLGCDIAPTGEDRYRAIGRLEGNFPGGTAQLHWDFTLAGDLIRRLEIAP